MGKNKIDHWTFLEEIEAPMWADLTLEPNMTVEDNDDAWFCTDHSFHQLSARQLRSAFAHPDVGNDFVNFNLQGPCSPKLPSSVSKSRGKDYTSKPMRKIDVFSVSTNHPVNDLGGGISILDKDSIPENPTESSNNSCVTIVASNSQVATDGRNTCGSLNSGVSTSTITTVSQRHDTKLSEWSTKEGFGRTSGLLNALKANLRRSCATRPASRIEICDDRELKGRKSSSGKSSVGSSSIGYDGEVRRSAILTKSDHFEKVKMNVKMKQAFHKSLTGNKENKDESLGVKSSEIFAAPIKGRVIGKKVVDAPLKKTTAIVRDVGKLALPVKGQTKAQKPVEASFKSGTCLKQKEYRSSIVRDGGKLAPPVKGRTKAQKPVEASFKSETCLKQKEYRSSTVRDVGKLAPPVKGRANGQKLVEASKSGTSSGSRIEGRGAVAASACLQAVKSKVSISENVTSRPRFGAPSVKGKVERAAQLNGTSRSINEKTKRVPLSRISSGNYNLQHACCKTNRSEETCKVVGKQNQCSVRWFEG